MFSHFWRQRRTGVQARRASDHRRGRVQAAHRTGCATRRPQPAAESRTPGLAARSSCQSLRPAATTAGHWPRSATLAVLTDLVLAEPCSGGLSSLGAEARSWRHQARRPTKADFLWGRQAAADRAERKPWPPTSVRPWSGGRLHDLVVSRRDGINLREIVDSPAGAAGSCFSTNSMRLVGCETTRPNMARSSASSTPAPDARRMPWASLLVAATNHEKLLDAALWRRFDDVSGFSHPTVHQIRALLRTQARADPHDETQHRRSRLRAPKGLLRGRGVRRLVHIGLRYWRQENVTALHLMEAIEKPAAGDW